MEFYTSEKVTKRITRIRDILGVYAYLVEGENRACLLDTGNGYGNIKEYISNLTRKETFVILTHGHLDHASGASLFNEVYMNENDIDLFRVHISPEYRQKQNENEELVKSIPIEDYIPAMESNPRPLLDGDRFDLGGIHLQIVSVPGHTPGMSCVLIEEEKTMLFGDACGLFTLLFEKYSSNVSEYKENLKYLKTFESKYDYVLRNHGVGYSDKSLLDNVIECCESILNGTDAKIPIQFMGIDLLSAANVDEKSQRIDGKEGNIIYLLEKAK